MSVCRCGFWDLINNFYRTRRWYFLLLWFFDWSLVQSLVDSRFSTEDSFLFSRWNTIYLIKKIKLQKASKTRVRHLTCAWCQEKLPRKCPSAFSLLYRSVLSFSLKFLIFNAENKTNQPHQRCVICARVSRMRIKYESFSASFNALQNV